MHIKYWWFPYQILFAYLLKLYTPFSENVQVQLSIHLSPPQGETCVVFNFQLHVANLFRDRNKLWQVESLECSLHCITTHTMHWSEGELQSKRRILLPPVTILLNLIEVSFEDRGQGVHNLGWLLFHDGCVPGGGPGGEISIDVVWDIDIVWRNDLGTRRVRTAWTRWSLLMTINLCSNMPTLASILQSWYTCTGSTHPHMYMQQLSHAIIP